MFKTGVQRISLSCEDAMEWAFALAEPFPKRPYDKIGAPVTARQATRDNTSRLK
jgi:hypothetical protein